MKTRQNPFNYAANYYNFPFLGVLNSSTKARMSRVIDLVGRNKRILDTGCFDGALSEYFKKNNNDVYGIDASKYAVREAKKRGIKARLANLETKFPFPSSMFDLVFAGEIIEHILDTDFFVEEIKRVLKPKGEIVLTTPNAASLGRRILLITGGNPFFEASFSFPGKPAGHVRYYTEGLLKSFLETYKLKVVSFQSDRVNFSPNYGSEFLARIIPSLGASLIFKCVKA